MLLASRSARTGKENGREGARGVSELLLQQTGDVGHMRILMYYFINLNTFSSSVPSRLQTRLAAS